MRRKLTPEFQKSLRRSQRQIWVFGAAAICAVLGIVTGVILGLLHLFNVSFGG